MILQTLTANKIKALLRIDSPEYNYSISILKEGVFMFRPDDILARLQQQPFRPFRIIASEGQRFEIPHPDLVLVCQRDIMIGFPSSQNSRIYDGVTRVALVHIVALEDISVSASPGAAG